MWSKKKGVYVLKFLLIVKGADYSEPYYSVREIRRFKDFKYNTDQAYGNMIEVRITTSEEFRKYRCQMVLEITRF